MTKQPNHSGFTILEVLLFVTISGVLMALLMAGWSSMVNRQEYRDSQLSVQTYLQQQYNLVQNVENGRTNNLSCTATSTLVTINSGSQPRGQTECVLLGRLVVLKRGTNFTSYAVVGRDISPSTTTPDDLTATQNARPTIVSQDIGLSELEKTIPWQGVAYINDPASDSVAEAGQPGGTLQNVALFIARSPTSGNIHTYRLEINQDDNPTSIDLSSISISSQPTLMCIESGLPLSGERLGVKVDQLASSQSGVSTITGTDGGCL